MNNVQIKGTKINRNLHVSYTIDAESIEWVRSRRDPPRSFSSSCLYM